jgi:hypothetical protein
MAGSKVWENYLHGEIAGIRNYCETDVLNTYLVYLQFEYMRGNLAWDELMLRQQTLRNYLTEQQQEHFNQFLALWQLK